MLSRQYIYWGDKDLLRGLAGRRSKALNPEPVGVSSLGNKIPEQVLNLLFHFKPYLPSVCRDNTLSTDQPGQPFFFSGGGVVLLNKW